MSDLPRGDASAQSSPDERDDLALVLDARNGNRHAFGLLVTRYQKPIYNVAFRITSQREDAMDATQDAFLAAYRRLDSFDPSRPFFSWLFRIGVNSAIDVAQRRDRRREEEESELVDDSPSPEDERRGSEVSAAIERVLPELSTEQRAVLVLRHLQELSYEQIGGHLGIPVKTVRSRLFSARRRLRELLREAGVAPP